MTVMVERRPDASEASCAADAAALTARVKDIIGISITVDLKPAGSLDRSQGKAKRVIDRRPKI
jgi:phenylacetate-CoA ligase